MGPRRRGALGGCEARTQGASICGHIGATEDAASRRPACSGGSELHCVGSSYNQGMKIGVLAVQGNFREHVAMLRALGAEVVEVRLPEQLEGLDGLVIPGGESTAITRLMRLY